MRKAKNKKALIGDTILKFLFVYGKVRAVDAARYASYKYETSAKGSEICGRLKKAGLISEYTYYLTVSTREGKKTIEDKVYAITQEGKEYINKLYPELQPQVEYVKQDQDNMKESASLNKRLTDRGIMLNFLAVGVAVFPDEKPSIDHLQLMLGTGRVDKAKMPEGYKDDLNKEECALFMKNRVNKETGEFICGGAYYTINEFIKYIKRNETLADTFKGTRVRGIFISQDNCYLVFTPKRYSNRILNLKYKSEISLLVALKKTFSTFTEIYRPIRELSSVTYIRENRPAAIVFSDGKRLSYEMATGNIKGQSKGSSDNIRNVSDMEKHNAMHLSDINAPKGSGNETLNSNAEVASTYLTAGTDLFDDVYVTSLSINGMNALGYLVSNSKENMIASARMAIESVPDFYKAGNNIGLYPYNNRKYPENSSEPEYVPVINVKQMRWIRERGGVPFIITDEDLLDPIAHSIKLPAHYYDASTGEEFPEDSVFIYTENGRIAGLEILQQALKARGLTISAPHEWSEVGKRMGMERIELYNKLARGEVDLEAVIENTKVKPCEDAKLKSSKKFWVSVALNKTQVAALDELKTKEGVSTSAYFRRLMIEDLKRRREKESKEKSNNL